MSLTQQELGLKIGQELSDPLNPTAHKVPVAINISQELLKTYRVFL